MNNCSKCLFFVYAATSWKEFIGVCDSIDKWGALQTATTRNEIRPPYELVEWHSTDKITSACMISMYYCIITLMHG